MTAVDAAQALRELSEISSEIEAAAIVDEEGTVVAALPDNADALAGAGKALLARAADVQGREPTRLSASTAKGSVFVVRGDGRTIVARTAPDATTGLVFFDLEHCLRDAS